MDKTGLVGAVGIQRSFYIGPRVDHDGALVAEGTWGDALDSIWESLFGMPQTETVRTIR